MSLLVVDTDVVSYIFKCHPLAPAYADILKDNEPFISFVTRAELWGDVVAGSIRLGRALDPQDGWIAATALRLKAALVTNNVKRFVPIRGLKIRTAVSLE